MSTTTQRPLPPDAIAGLSSIAEACDVLRAWGHPDLADRLAYFASDADLEEGDERLTLESAQGFPVLLRRGGVGCRDALGMYARGLDLRRMGFLRQTGRWPMVP